MSRELVSYVQLSVAAERLSGVSNEFALIHNAPHVFPPFEAVPLGTRAAYFHSGIRAIFLDMDGTTTLTEDLCLVALEDTMRLIMERPGKAEWPGLDRARDYPNIIGSSTSKNFEYLIHVYGDDVREPALRAAFVRAAALTLAEASDPERIAEVRADLSALGVPELAYEPAIATLPAYARGRTFGQEVDVSDLVARYAPRLRLQSLAERFRAAMMIYFERIDGMFARIALGRGHEVAEELYGPGTLHPIRPLPGLGVLHALAKGWLGDEAGRLADLVLEHTGPVEGAADTLARLGRTFAAQPAHVALVTSSGDYEANIILTEVFGGLRDEVRGWPVSEAVRERVLSGFEHYLGFYDTVVTASHSHEIRLKPYRDLYSIALHNLGIPAEDAHKVLGFEDTEAGIVAQRAAGLGVCCAVPFEGSRGHNFTAASHVLHGGLPEALLRHGLFMR